MLFVRVTIELGWQLLEFTESLSKRKATNIKKIGVTLARGLS